MRHSEGSTVSGPRNGWPVDVYEGGVKVRQAVIVRQSFDTRERLLYDADGRAYAPRRVGLGVEEVEVVES
jgi:hypothetical protein